MHWDTYKQGNYSTVGGDGDVGSARYEPALLPAMPDHKGFMLQELSEIHPLTPAIQGLIKINNSLFNGLPELL